MAANTHERLTNSSPAAHTGGFRLVGYGLAHLADTPAERAFVINAHGMLLPNGTAITICENSECEPDIKVWESARGRRGPARQLHRLAAVAGALSPRLRPAWTTPIEIDAVWYSYGAFTPTGTNPPSRSSVTSKSRRFPGPSGANRASRLRVFPAGDRPPNARRTTGKGGEAGWAYVH